MLCHNFKMCYCVIQSSIVSDGDFIVPESHRYYRIILSAFTYCDIL